MFRPQMRYTRTTCFGLVSKCDPSNAVSTYNDGITSSLIVDIQSRLDLVFNVVQVMVICYGAIWCPSKLNESIEYSAYIEDPMLDR